MRKSHLIVDKTWKTLCWQTLFVQTYKNKIYNTIQYHAEKKSENRNFCTFIFYKTQISFWATLRWKTSYNLSKFEILKPLQLYAKKQKSLLHLFLIIPEKVHFGSTLGLLWLKDHSKIFPPKGLYQVTFKHIHDLTLCKKSEKFWVPILHKTWKTSFWPKTSKQNNFKTLLL